MMDYIPLNLRSYKLYLIIPKNFRACLAKIFTLICIPRTSPTLLEINGAKIPPNKPAPIVLRRAESAKAESDTEVVYTSTDQVFTCDGLRFEVNLDGEKSLKGIFRQGVRWGLECELIGLNLWMEISVVTDQGFLIRERVKLRRNQFCQKLSVIEEEVQKEIGESNYLKHEHGIDNGDEAINKGINWAKNIEILIEFQKLGYSFPGLP